MTPDSSRSEKEIYSRSAGAVASSAVVVGVHFISYRLKCMIEYNIFNIPYGSIEMVQGFTAVQCTRAVKGRAQASERVSVTRGARLFLW